MERVKTAAGLVGLAGMVAGVILASGSMHSSRLVIPLELEPAVLVLLAGLAAIAFVLK